ncbi:hypothetical protein CANARDRAFT_27986 [[Candida] arabinofermentans NRRL YB-2248]|uniref:Reticulon-like protein n=1 Tax=[Candida] arabinofermentans NRRL YB-2248 TaxID=983967 RepID=A0A1E4T2D4_9ASCO|nr:hypothetical protein CANARDRAFT_27986 [[Candida] arabinofermentans NRRL YB-2248]
MSTINTPPPATTTTIPPTTTKSSCCGGACMTKSSCALLTWEDPAKSGKVFGGIIGSLLLFKYVNLVKVISWLGFWGLAISLITEYGSKKFTGQGLVTKLKPKYVTVVAQTTDKYATHVATILGKYEIAVQDLIYSVDFENTLKATATFFAIFQLSKLFSLWTALFISTLIAFTVPFAYLKNKTQVDKAVETYGKLAKDKALELIEIAKEKSGPALKSVETKLGPVSSFIKSKIPVRTAGSTVGESTPATTTSTTTTTTTKIPETTQINTPVIDETTPLTSATEETPIANPLA